MSAREYLDDLSAKGRRTFTSRDAQRAMGASSAAVRQALQRLAKQKLIASPARGFYVIVPPEYRSLGCLPAAQFLPDLMKWVGQPYYVGLLSAAEFYGAAHHKPQEFQVFVKRQRRPIECGRIRVRFIVRESISSVSVRMFNTPSGMLRVATPEATALDLVGYHKRAAGLDNVATVLTELAEHIDPLKLASAAATAPVAWAQRLGYLLEHLGAEAKTNRLRAYVQSHARVITSLAPDRPRHSAERDKDWKLYVNTVVESDV